MVYEVEPVAEAEEEVAVVDEVAEEYRFHRELYFLRVERKRQPHLQKDLRRVKRVSHLVQADPKQLRKAKTERVQMM